VPVGVVAILLYYLERVEGLRAPRVAFAIALVSGYWVRFFLLSRVARELVQALRPSLPLPAAEPSFWVSASSASVSALGMWFWAWPMIGLALFSPFALLAILPL